MSTSKKIVTVLGATGNQGGSIVSAWASNSDLQSKYTIRAVTRDTSKPAAQELKSKGAEVVAADLNDVESLKKAVEGAYAVFAVTNYWEFMDKTKELEQGKSIADASFAAGVTHLVWSSLPHTSKLTEGKLSQIDHFDAKAEVEEYIESKKSGSSTLASYFEPAFFMSNFQTMGFINPGQDGVPTFAVPHGPDAKYPMIDVKADTGSYVWGIIEAGSAADGKQVFAVSEWVTAQGIVDTLTKYGGAGEVKFAELPRDMFKGFLVQKMGDYLGEEMTQNMELIGEYSYFGKGTDAKQDESDKFLVKGAKKTTWQSFVEKNKPWGYGKQ